MTEQLQELEALMDAAAARLPHVIKKRLFGCQALYRERAVFALVWKTGRIGVKLPIPAQYHELMSKVGSEPWVAHAVMSQWVLVPKTFHSDPNLLFDWLKIAHGLADDEAATAVRTKSTKIVRSATKGSTRASTPRRRS
ncbi:TfoX/Sxy family protein [Mesorhizobium sp. M0006]|uniref:TfoX/Sxy family protein n=1 Tax=Mesorhizobium sp. M0006 TaxID=2956838 RepID=UPI00333868F6